MAAPPRRPATVENAVRNIERAARVVGAMPAIENIATLIDPPGSMLSEAAWVSAIAGASGAPLLLDLHNLHANAENFGFDPFAFLDSLPIRQVRQVHLAGGRLIPVRAPGRPRILDDHRHATPERVFRLLGHLAERCPQPLDVVLERDGSYPPFSELLSELEHAHEAVTRGRSRRTSLGGQAA